jgi:CheY-like chemotaxis protein
MNNHQSNGGAATPRILILDDEPMVGELLQEILGLLDYKTKFCESPTEALALLDTEAFDLVLSDFRMPEMTGADFYDQAVAVNPALANRVVFLTGDAISEDAQSFLATTGCRHLSKPFQFDQIKVTIEEALQGHETIRA